MRKNRNPYAGSLSKPQYQPKVSKSSKERASQRDGWSRDGKHKSKTRNIELEEDDSPSLQLGDEVKYVGDDEDLKGKEGLVKLPNSHYGQVGVTFDGAYTLVDADKLEIIEESLQRLRMISEMKYFANTSGVRIPVSNEEEEIFELMDNKDILKSELNERQQEVARQMVNRGLLKRITTRDKKIKFRKNKDDIRRD